MINRDKIVKIVLSLLVGFTLLLGSFLSPVWAHPEQAPHRPATLQHMPETGEHNSSAKYATGLLGLVGLLIFLLVREERRETRELD